MPTITQQPVRVRGLREMNRAFARADKKLGKDLRGRLRDVAKPIASDAESLARSQISHIGVRWPRMRVGVTRTLVYVAPKERGVRSRADASRRRPKFADRLMDDAMSPALNRHIRDVEAGVGRVLDDVGRDWERG